MMKLLQVARPIIYYMQKMTVNISTLSLANAKHKHLHTG